MTTKEEKTQPPSDDKRLFASQSFTPEEIGWLDELLRAVLRGGDLRVLLKNKAMVGAWLKKVLSMKRRVEKLRADQARPSVS